ncbi:nitroreductase family deazaflavin-dependent oxidoreductase [Nocardia yamanashiensis]|uniref:nitroreductase family deazaflavin-dependent oxidoreductase n=1 Tax=Nocardia yamanashiensis TaxID=209247 RepID=UPI001E5B70D0|nr:nitroreductase family deazaflavin-dependent oxidoreductase [Nocardia yamanashiensis]UGT38687.1 nitroreductase family deazaflavin-dependent oxidoreductase [Nocardia yamanashiensis]
MTGSAQDVARRFRWTRRLQRYVLNPPMRLLVSAGLVADHAILETVGRKTGKRRLNVVSVKPDGRTLWVVSEHGRRAGYVANIGAQPRIRVRFGRQWYPATATLLPEDDARARLADNWSQESARRAIERFGTALMTIRIDLDEPPRP